MAAAEDEALAGSCGILACSPEMYDELFVDAGFFELMKEQGMVPEIQVTVPADVIAKVKRC